MNETLHSSAVKFHTIMWQHNSGVVEDFTLQYFTAYLRIQN